MEMKQREKVNMSANPKWIILIVNLPLIIIAVLYTIFIPNMISFFGSDEVITIWIFASLIYFGNIVTLLLLTKFYQVVIVSNEKIVDKRLFPIKGVRIKSDEIDSIMVVTFTNIDQILHGEYQIGSYRAHVYGKLSDKYIFIKSKQEDASGENLYEYFLPAKYYKSIRLEHDDKIIAALKKYGYEIKYIECQADVLTPLKK